MICNLAFLHHDDVAQWQVRAQGQAHTKGCGSCVVHVLGKENFERE